MLALPVLQLAMLVSPSGRWAHGPVRSAFRRCAEAQCGACADFCVGWLGASRGHAEKAESKLLPNVRDELIESQMQCMCEVMQARLGLSEAELRKVVLRLPQVLGYSIEGNILPSLTALQARLGLSEAELRTVVLRLPAVLGYSMDDNVLPTIDFLQGELGLTDKRLRERIVGYPAMLGCSIERRLRPRVELCHEMGLPAERMLFNYFSRKPEDFNAACARYKSTLDE